jgi:hypothetical protein
MIIEIKPLAIWKNGANRTATKIEIYEFYNYDFVSGAGAVAYRLLNADTETLIHETLALPADLIASWGADDQPIFDYVLETLKLEVNENGEIAD